MYVDRVNWLVIECHVIENASTGGDIYGKVVGTISNVGGARGLVSGVNSGNNSFDPKDAIRPKNMAWLH